MCPINVLQSLRSPATISEHSEHADSTSIAVRRVFFTVDNHNKNEKYARNARTNTHTRVLLKLAKACVVLCVWLQFHNYKLRFPVLRETKRAVVDPNNKFRHQRNLLQLIFENIDQQHTDRWLYETTDQTQNSYDNDKNKSSYWNWYGQCFTQALLDRLESVMHKHCIYSVET